MAEGYILIVDDEEQVHTLLSLILRNLPHECRFALHGGEAFEMIKEELPGVILLDLMMPIIDGYSLLEMMADDPAMSSVPVMIFTAAVEKVLNRDWPAQVVEVVPKAKYTPSELRALIQKYL